MNFIHLHIHSQYSMMRGTAGLESLCRRAKELGMEAMALTDTNGLYGLVCFIQIAVETGIRPIVGAEVVTPASRAVLLVKDRKGYEGLCRIITRRHTDHAFDLADALCANSEGLVVLSDTIPLLRRLKGRDDLYAELTGGKQWRRVLNAAVRYGIPAAATNGVYFLHPGEYGLHRLLRAIDLNTKLSRLSEAETAPPQAWLKPQAAMAAVFPDVPDALENTWIIAEKCSYRPDFRPTLPSGFEGMDAETVMRVLRRKCEKGAVRRYGEITAPVRERLNRELGIIGEKGFGAVFLMMADIVGRAPRTCGRGSAAASIVSYCLGITHVDPVKHNLFFERFLNPGRLDPPDIDVDFPWDERDDILDYVFKKYGPERSAMVANHVGMRLRAAVREVAKVYGLPDNEIKQVTDRLSHLWTWGGDDVETVVRSHPIFRDLGMPVPWPAILKWAGRIQGMVRYLSVHCGGVVIVPDGLDRHVPVQQAPKGVRIIQWEKDQTEEGGLIKMDLLGNRSLAVIRDALAAVQRNTGEVIPYDTLNPLDDPRTRDLIRQGDTLGVFYIESPAMRQLQKKTGVGDYEHVVIHSSIIRPAANRYINAYVRRLKGEHYESLHPVLDRVLCETYGIMVYQEDVTKVAMEMAGFSAEAGDGLRKTLSKKRNARRLSGYREEFFCGARTRGIPDDVTGRVWDMILSFSGYSFCKPHSASYALVSFKSAWLRAHYPAEFMAAVISNQGGYYAPFAYLSECQRMGLDILPPDINASDKAYSGKGRAIRVGLMQLKGLKGKALERVLDERRRSGPFPSFEIFCRRTALDPSDMRVLIKAGCFDTVAGGKSRAELLWEVYAGRKPKSVTPQMEMDLFGHEALRMPRLGDYDFRTMLLHEVEVLGFPLSVHPLDLFRKQLTGLNFVPAKEIHRHVGKRITTIGWWVTNKLVYTRQEEPMSFISFEDTTALYETVFFPEAFRRFCSKWTRTRPYVLTGRVDDDMGAVSLHVENMAFLDEPGRGGERRRPAIGTVPMKRLQ